MLPGTRRLCLGPKVRKNLDFELKANGHRSGLKREYD
jgi:hypothetical protein